MITLEKIGLFKKYYWEYFYTVDGNGDYPKQFEGVIRFEEFGIIRGLLNEMFYVKKELASVEWANRVAQNLGKYCENEETIKEMWKLRDYIEEIEKIEKRKRNEI